MKPDNYRPLGSWRTIEVPPDPWEGQLVRGLREETDYKATRKD